jgi:hypothetical protein
MGYLLQSVVPLSKRARVVVPRQCTIRLKIRLLLASPSAFGFYSASIRLPFDFTFLVLEAADTIAAEIILPAALSGDRRFRASMLLVQYLHVPRYETPHQNIHKLIAPCSSDGGPM